MYIRTLSFLTIMCSTAPLALMGCGGSDRSSGNNDMSAGGNQDLGGTGGGHDSGSGGGDMSSSTGSDDSGTQPNLPHFGTFIQVTFNSDNDVPTAAINWTDNVDLDTDADPMGLCNHNNDRAGQYCVVTGTNITLANGKTLRAHGSKPLILLATGTFDLGGGTIDVSSNKTLTGAGAVTGSALANACTGTTAATGVGGGFGGSFQGVGGPGGHDTGGSPGDTASDFPTELRGGCPGGDGSPADATHGKAGNGGGAVAVIANAITLNGSINASGAGGGGAAKLQAGGGGGGSGGMIVLDAPSITPTAGAQVWANGGGGGEGGNSTVAGNDGGQSPDPSTNAPGGVNILTGGGPGGPGSAGVTELGLQGHLGNSGGSTDGGGGGGGGAGFVGIFGVSSIDDNTVTISPLELFPTP